MLGVKQSLTLVKVWSEVTVQRVNDRQSVSVELPCVFEDTSTNVNVGDRKRSAGTV